MPGQYELYKTPRLSHSTSKLSIKDDREMNKARLIPKAHFQVHVWCLSRTIWLSRHSEAPTFQELMLEDAGRKAVQRCLQEEPNEVVFCFFPPRVSPAAIFLPAAPPEVPPF